MIKIVLYPNYVDNWQKIVEKNPIRRVTDIKTQDKTLAHFYRPLCDAPFEARQLSRLRQMHLLKFLDSYLLFGRYITPGWFSVTLSMSSMS